MTNDNRLQIRSAKGINMKDKDSDIAGAAAYEKSVIEPEPMDPAAASERLKDIKRILDQLGAVFFIASGTCLGAIRDGGFIPWDDEMDMGSVIGLN